MKEIFIIFIVVTFVAYIVHRIINSRPTPGDDEVND